MAEVEVASLRVALLKQCVIIKKLYDELEEERNASATAASEALSMILRLEREKSAEKMEACQYKRMSEERMQHVEESLEMFEELMQQKDTEISFLRCRLQACQGRLLGVGIKIPDGREMKFYRSPSLSGRNTSTEISSCGCVRRNTSMPSLKNDKWQCEIDHSDGGSPLSEHSIWREMNDYTNQLADKCEESQILDFYEESVKQAEVNKKVKVLMQAKDDEVKAFPEIKERQSSSTGKGAMYLAKGSTSASCHLELNGRTSSSVNVHDIFEIPECQRGYRATEPKEVLKSRILGSENVLKMADFLSQEAIDYVFSDDNWLNMQCMNNYSGSKLPKSREGSFVDHANKFLRPQPSVNNDSAVTGPEIGVSTPLSNVEQLRRWLHKLEDGRVINQEDADTGEDQSGLLHEIYKQLDTIEAQLKGSYKKLPLQDDPSVVSVMEAVLSFSI